MGAHSLLLPSFPMLRTGHSLPPPVLAGKGAAFPRVWCRAGRSPRGRSSVRVGEKVREPRKYGGGVGSERRRGEAPFRNGGRNGVASPRKDFGQFREKLRRKEFGSSGEDIGVLDYDEVNVDAFSDLEDGVDEGVSGDFNLSGGEDASGDLDVNASKFSSIGYVGDGDSYLTETRFDEYPISALSLKGVKAAGYEKMTVVQKETIHSILEGNDVLAKAKTGTGKTVAFLLPAIEGILNLPVPDRDNKRPPISVLILCPTRELACQVAAEAKILLKFHTFISVYVVIGGTRLTTEQKHLQANFCQILVATPGRLKDHIENTPGFVGRLRGIKVLVLDEADRLLDMGFRRDIEQIITVLSKQRQTLLFSATIPKEVEQICQVTLKKDFKFVNTVEEGSEETHSQVRQMHLIAPMDNHFSAVSRILEDHIREDADYKVLVFCTTAMVTKLVAELLSQMNLNVREIHSRKTQSYRTKVSDEFRKSKGLILVTSDVSARGVDYPDVTLVIQLGLPSSREQYIHRIGRTGRKGKEGQGILLLAPWEKFFLSSVGDLPLTNYPSPTVNPDTTDKINRALSMIEMKSKEAAYQAWLGYYNSDKDIGRDKARLVELAKEFSRSMGLNKPPIISELVLRKMGLRNVPGLQSK